MINFKKENISVKNYCLHQTKVGDQVDIYNSGYYVATCIIDSEDLFVRYLSDELGKQYVDCVDVYTRTIIDKESDKVFHFAGEEVRTTKCTYHRVHIGYSKTDFNKFRMVMNTDKGTMYTRWYNKKEAKTAIRLDVDESFKKMLRESDEMLKYSTNWNRHVEYYRTWPEDKKLPESILKLLEV